MIETYDILSPKQCNTIIDHFNNDKDRTPGQVGANLVDITKKHSTDLGCSFDQSYQDNYNNIIMPAINAGLIDYTAKYSYLLEGSEFSVYNDYNIQHYKHGEGYGVVHCETMPIKGKLKFIYRMMAWMIYLNDAVSGTHFPYQDVTIKPKQGMLVLWPSYWTHVHRGVVPNVGDKYIATGWLNYTPDQ